MRKEIEKLRSACRELAQERRLAELSRIPGAPPYRTVQDFVAGSQPSGRTLMRLELALALFVAADGGLNQ